MANVGGPSPPSSTTHEVAPKQRITGPVSERVSDMGVLRSVHVCVIIATHLKPTSRYIYDMIMC